MPVPRKTIQLHRAQLNYRRSNALYRGYVGGIGSGKSFVGAYDLLRRAKPDRLYMAIAPTYPMLRDASLRAFLSQARALSFLKHFARTEQIATLGNGAEVLFRSADDPERLRGPNISGIWADEASLMSRGAFDISIGRLREGGEMGWFGATFTPKGKGHWTYPVFGMAAPDTELFHSRTGDNPFLPSEFVKTLQAQYNSQFARQELGGEFTEGLTTLFQRHWFGIVEAAPADLQRVRSWDLAASEAKDSNDPDWSVGILMGKSKEGIFYVLDMRRIRGTPGQVERLVRSTAEQDGIGTKIVMEEEGGASGKGMTDHYRRYVIPSFNFHGIRATGEKTVRAQALSGQSEAGNVKIVRAAWNKDFLDELESFPSEGIHDDIVDASSQAVNDLSLNLPKKFWVL